MEAFVMLIALLAGVVGGLSVLLYFSQVLEPEHLRVAGRRVRHWQFTIRQMMAAVVVAALLFHMFTSREGIVSFWLLCLGFVIWFARIWQKELVFLMGLRDGDLPGRYDKLIWAAVLMAFAPVGVWFFRSYRLTHWPEPAPVIDPERQADEAGGPAAQPA
jgi:hypothetical protein